MPKGQRAKSNTFAYTSFFNEAHYMPKPYCHIINVLNRSVYISTDKIQSFRFEIRFDKNTSSVTALLISASNETNISFVRHRWIPVQR